MLQPGHLLRPCPEQPALLMCSLDATADPCFSCPACRLLACSAAWLRANAGRRNALDPGTRSFRRTLCPAVFIITCGLVRLSDLPDGERVPELLDETHLGGLRAIFLSSVRPDDEVRKLTKK